jgi:hypothetical protein
VFFSFWNYGLAKNEDSGLPGQEKIRDPKGAETASIPTHNVEWEAKINKHLLPCFPRFARESSAQIMRTTRPNHMIIRL